MATNMSIQRMTVAQLRPIARAVVAASTEKAEAGLRPAALDGEPMAAKLTFAWIDTVDEYCSRYGKKHRRSMLAMIRRGLVAFAAAWDISHPALDDDVAALRERMANDAAEDQLRRDRYNKTLAAMLPEEAARWDELKIREKYAIGKARKRIKEKQSRLFRRVGERLATR